VCLVNAVVDVQLVTGVLTLVSVHALLTSSKFVCGFTIRLYAYSCTAVGT
jgi:hypothetical protein